MKSKHITGNISGLTVSELRKLDKVFHRKVSRDEIISLDLARELILVAENLRRRVGVLISREGRIEEVFLGTKNIIYLPDLGRYRLGSDRLRRLRFIFTDLSANDAPASIPSDVYTDLEKLRLDMVVSLKQYRKKTTIAYAHLSANVNENNINTTTEGVNDLSQFEFDFIDFMTGLEDELSRQAALNNVDNSSGVILVGVYSKSIVDPEGSMDELKELARTAGVKVKDVIFQYREPDPKTLLGKGKIEEVVLRCLKVGAEMIVFDTELKPSQWRAVTNSTELKVIDRSMLILDIFAQRATSSDGRLQVELAQLKYNLPRLVEKDAGLSRLTGGIGGRGPGETKLEIGRRRIRDRISELEKKIDQLGAQRELRRTRRLENKLPLVCLIGYTNVGKSTIFNILTKSKVIAENKLFATLDPAQRRMQFVGTYDVKQIILSDTVGLIRDLPAELTTAFRATLEELHNASLLVHVMDASDSKLEERIASVDSVLSSMKLKDIPSINVLNKCDKISEEQSELLHRQYSGIIVSAISGKGLGNLRNEISQHIFGNIFEAQEISI
jgi:GTPase